uniref:U34-Sparatoxin-Hju1a_1 n=1 Tax=Heteropoda jugulans TaxID=1358901 RepID=A0A4V2H9J3_9ARAC
MKFALTVVFMAVTALVVISAEAPEGGSLDFFSGAREDCAFQTCEVFLDCQERPGECYITGQICKCIKKPGESASWSIIAD